MVGWFRKIAPIATTPVQQIATTPAIHNKIQEAVKSQLQPQQSLPFLSNFNLRIIFDVKLIIFLVEIGLEAFRSPERSHTGREPIPYTSLFEVYKTSVLF